MFLAATFITIVMSFVVSAIVGISMDNNQPLAAVICHILTCGVIYLIIVRDIIHMGEKPHDQ